MLACNHEEADTRIVVHVLHALEQGMKSVLVRTVDTDVIVILVGVYAKLATIQPLAVIWVAFGTDRNYTPLDAQGPLKDTSRRTHTTV